MTLSHIGILICLFVALGALVWGAAVQWPRPSWWLIIAFIALALALLGFAEVI